MATGSTGLGRPAQVSGKGAQETSQKEEEGVTLPVRNAVFNPESIPLCCPGQCGPRSPPCPPRLLAPLRSQSKGSETCGQTAECRRPLR